MKNWSSPKKLVKQLVRIFVGNSLLAVDWAQRLAGLEVPGTCVVLCYHAIRKSDRDRFARQMDLLVRWTTPVAAGFQGHLSPGLRYAAVTIDDAYRCTVRNAIPILLDRGIPCTVFAPSSRLGGLSDWEMEPDHPDRGSPIATAEELGSLPTGLVTIGSHSRTHPRLNSLSDADAQSELVGSRQDLEKMLRRKVELFAFPHGEYDDRILDLCRDAGYRRVFQVTPGDTRFETSEYAIHRVPASPRDPLPVFWTKLLGGYSWTGSRQSSQEEGMSPSEEQQGDPR